MARCGLAMLHWFFRHERELEKGKWWRRNLPALPAHRGDCLVASAPAGRLRNAANATLPLLEGTPFRTSLAAVPRYGAWRHHRVSTLGVLECTLHRSPSACSAACSFRRDFLFGSVERSNWVRKQGSAPSSSSEGEERGRQTMDPQFFQITALLHLQH